VDQNSTFLKMLLLKTPKVLCTNVADSSSLIVSLSSLRVIPRSPIPTHIPEGPLNVILKKKIKKLNIYVCNEIKKIKSV
jgi:hypothetical protein